jgi:predicted DNA-binding protein (MmcQ/YjbR family)
MTEGFRNRVRQVCEVLPGAECSDPWGGGHDAWKVGGKMFACIGAVNTGVSVKTAEIDTAQMLIEADIATKAPYFHRSWVHLPEDCASDELTHRLCSSYDLVRAGLTRKVQASLPPRQEIA